MRLNHSKSAIFGCFTIWQKKFNHYFCQPNKNRKLGILKNRGVAERLIAPVLKTGIPSRGSGVRIPPPLPSQYNSKLKPRIPYEFEVFCFLTLENYITSPRL